MSTSSERKSGLHYEISPEGVHIFKFPEDGDNALDDFFEILEQILKSSPLDETIRYIVELEKSNNTGMRELVKQFGKLQARVPQRAPGRTAIIHRGDMFLMLANTFLNLAPRQDKAKFFKHTEYDKVKEWVLSDD